MLRNLGRALKLNMTMLDFSADSAGEPADISMVHNSDDDFTIAHSSALDLETLSSAQPSTVSASSLPCGGSSMLPSTVTSLGSSIIPSNGLFYQCQSPAFSPPPPQQQQNLLLQNPLVCSMSQTPNSLDQQQLLLLQQQHLLSNAHSLPHNLIPFHLQTAQPNLLLNLNGTPGYPPALIPQLVQQPQQIAYPHSFTNSNIAIQSPQSTAIYTVQDRPLEQPIYNGVNPAYPGLRILNVQPPIFCVDNFLTDFECDFLIEHAQDSFGPAPVVGKGAGEVSPSRTSSTCYLAREDLPDVLRKVSVLTGKPFEHCELPQVGRYFPSQQYLQHFDAFDLSTEDGRRFALNGGQRTVTVLMYLNTVARGGATRFPALNIDVQPVRGLALVFFPATVDGFLDKMALHAAMPAIDTKYVSQIWIRQSVYTGLPSKRLPQTLGVPFGQEQSQPPLQFQQPFGVSMMDIKGHESQHVQHGSSMQF